MRLPGVPATKKKAVQKTANVAKKIMKGAPAVELAQMTKLARIANKAKAN